MPKANDDLSDQVELMSRVASHYYLDQLTQGEIAKSLNISRAKVGRLLKKAREEGVVEISVHPHPDLSIQLEKELVDRFSLRRALIAIDQQDPNLQRTAVARLVAGYLSHDLRDDMTVAVGMGRNTSAIADNVFNPLQHTCIFVSAIGGLSRAGESINPDHTCRQLAERFGGQTEILYAPAYVEDQGIRNSFLSHETIRQTLDRARRADLAIVGIGDVSENSNVVRMGWLSAQEMSQLRRSGAVGDILGYFFDINGAPTENDMQGRVVGLNMEGLHHIPTVIAIASESSKPLSILGALRIGIIDILATSASNAQAVLTLDSEAYGTK
jgi:DNA-binding transcriptional regulator LsrR (DeoR family)